MRYLHLFAFLFDQVVTTTDAILASICVSFLIRSSRRPMRYLHLFAFLFDQVVTTTDATCILNSSAPPILVLKHSWCCSLLLRPLGFTDIADVLQHLADV
jgi:hypothetical protein